jgi:hypothetical protein
MKQFTETIRSLGPVPKLEDGLENTSKLVNKGGE